MGIDLHPDCRHRLAERLAEALSTIRVEKGQFLVFSSLRNLADLDSTLPQGQVRQRLEQYLSEDAFSDFVVGWLTADLLSTQTYNGAQSAVPLTNLEPYRDPAAAAERVVSDFQSLPWQYALTIQMPPATANALRQLGGQYALSTSVRVVTPDDLVTEYPPPSDTEAGLISFRALASLRGYEERWDPNGVYLQIRTSGFIPRFGTSAPLDEGIDAIKSLIGLGLALGAFEQGNRFGEPPANTVVSIHRHAADKWRYEERTELDSTLSKFFNRLTFHYPDGADTEDKRKAFAHAVMERMGMIFSAGPLAKPLLLACQWLLDSYSYAGSDTMLAFVQAVVVLEILLGDKAISDVVGLGELLRNRCAYLIGKSHAERESILEDFPKMYKVRSNIVHAGKKRLNREEWVLFMRLRWICERVIYEESRMLAGRRK